MNRKDSKGRVLKANEYERTDGRYVYRYVENGKEKRIYSWRLIETDPQVKGKPKCECLRELEKTIDKDLQDGIVQSKVTLNERWNEYISNKPELKQSTRTNYKYMYDKYIRNDIGIKLLKSINFSTMRKFFNKLLQKFKPNSIEIIHTILNPVFTTAVRDGLIRINPLAGIMADLKKSNDWEKDKRHALSKEHQLALVEFVRTHPVYCKWYSLIVCLLGTGCRISEMLGLRWEDIHWSDNIISINHNMIYRLQDDGSVQFRITTTKTKNGKRDIPMFKSVQDALKAEYKRQTKEGFCTKELEGYTGFIWMNRYNDLLSPHNVNRALERIRNEYNIMEETRAKQERRKPDFIPHFSAHHLRHTFCVRLCEEETDLKLIQEIMGHADISTTMDIYNESNIQRKKERFAALEKVSNVF